MVLVVALTEVPRALGQPWLVSNAALACGSESVEVTSIRLLTITFDSSRLEVCLTLAQGPGGHFSVS
jgi:hypothetical protein